MAVQVAMLREFKVDLSGTIIPDNSTLADNKQFTKEWRVVEDAALATTTGNPTIEAYLAAEDLAGRKFAGMIGAIRIVTQS